MGLGDVIDASGRVAVLGFLVLNIRLYINDKIKHYK
ncbi:hypothetical protein BAZSYMA_ACONTIG04796_3 [Bathymodiolus azoricus thioautotrophic gill symbiont]|uniref:Uncharacterized protein n=1 Tax=Bathymodiolus azoricus thioautotrophic gill symbiont TaxID=235205 RepID=A0A1H6KS23_9GAMM|nr:hypothetical protein BAZSYMA_ACONTIG04796_3 [Bathymodiolus azoricus thioautotrophic gill symbiont]